MGGDTRTSVIKAVASSHASVPSKRLPRRWFRQLGQNLRIFPFALILLVSLGASVFIGSSASTELDIIALGLLLTSTTVLIVTLAVTEPSIVRQMTATGSARLVQPDTRPPKTQQREQPARKRGSSCLTRSEGRAGEVTRKNFRQESRGPLRRKESWGFHKLRCS